MAIQERMLSLIAAHDDLNAKLEQIRTTAEFLRTNVDAGYNSLPEAFSTLIGWCLTETHPTPATIITLANERAHFRTNGKRNLRERSRQHRKRHPSDALSP